MRHLIRGLVAVAVVALGAAAIVLPASGESRLFTVRTDAPGVTIVRAMQAGRDLAVAGQSGGATFFRIENPAGAVPCGNRIAFTTSSGQTYDINADLCANNWELVIGVASAQPPAPPAPTVAVPAPAPAVAVPRTAAAGHRPAGGHRHRRSERHDHRSLPPRPAGAGQRAPGRLCAHHRADRPAGLECQRDLGLALSDGRRIARLVDICASNFLVVVPLTGGPRPPAPPPTFVPAPQPAQPLPMPQPQPQPQPAPQPGLPDFVSNMQWMFDPLDGRNAALQYMLPNTEVSEFSAVCAVGSGQMTVTLNRAPAAARPGQQIGVRITAGATSQVYTATMGPVNEITSRSHPVMQIGAGDPLWPAIARESVLSIAMNDVQPYGLSLRGSAAAVRPFLAACSQRVQPPTPLPTPGPTPCPVRSRPVRCRRRCRDRAPTPSASIATTARSSASPSTRRRRSSTNPVRRRSSSSAPNRSKGPAMSPACRNWSAAPRASTGRATADTRGPASGTSRAVTGAVLPAGTGGTGTAGLKAARHVHCCFVRNRPPRGVGR